MRSAVIDTLDTLLQENIITGYNYFPRKLPSQTRSRLILSSLHETDAYLADVIKSLAELGYPDENVDFHVRTRFTSTRWFPEYRIRDDKGELYPSLKIRNGETYLDLQTISFITLFDFYKKDFPKGLIGENKGYEIVLSSSNVLEIQKLAEIFIMKTENSLDSWKDAYSIPLILIEGLQEKIPYFKEATLYRKINNDGEYSFVALLLSQEINDVIRSLGFISKPCLANKLFVRKLRKEFKL